MPPLEDMETIKSHASIVESLKLMISVLDESEIACGIGYGDAMSADLPPRTHWDRSTFGYRNAIEPPPEMSENMVQFMKEKL